MTLQKLRSLHGQLGTLASFWLVLAGLTTLVINHRQWILPAPASGQTPYSQFLNCHAHCASQPDRLLVGTARGLYISEDSGASFSPVALPTPDPSILAVAFHPNEPNHLYAVVRGVGIFSSLDEGKLWTSVSFPSKGAIQSFHVGMDGSLSVLTPEGLHRRVDERWTLVPAPSSREDLGPSRGRAFVKLAYNLHDGQFWGRAAVVVTDAVALSLLALVGSGLYLRWKAPKALAPKAPDAVSERT